MSRRSETWVYGCICVVIALGIVFLFVNPIIAFLVVIIAVLTIVNIFVYRTQRYEVSSEPLTRPSTPSEEEERPSILETFQEPETDFELRTDLDEKSPEWKVSPPTPEPLSEPETKYSTEELQQRIAELEKRVQSLNEQLARDSLANGESSTPLYDENERSKEDDEEELSEKATQYLLETLDEKLAKRAISKQLYNRLRDKYIARMEKTKRRRITSAKRGTKDSIAGDQ